MDEESETHTVALSVKLIQLIEIKITNKLGPLWFTLSVFEAGNSLTVGVRTVRAIGQIGQNKQ